MTLPDGADAGHHDNDTPDTAAQNSGAGDAGRHEEGGPGENAHDAAGTAIERTQISAVSPVDMDIDPFLAAASSGPFEPKDEEDQPLYSKFLDYSAHAAMIVGLLGFAWTLSAHTGKQADAAQPKPVTVAAAENPVPAETAELRQNTQKMAAEISALRVSLEAVRSSMHGDTLRQDKTIDQIKAIAANLDSLKAGMSATKTETAATLAQLSGKIDHIQHGDALAKMQQVSERLEKLEHEEADTTVTASLPPAAKAAPVAVPPVKPQPLKSAALEAPDASKKPLADAEAPKKPLIIPEWVVREVDDGVAIVESRRGQLAVEPGVNIPGAGIVKSIERHGSSWTVTTSKGQLAYVPMREEAPRDYPRNSYRPGPEDF